LISEEVIFLLQILFSGVLLGGIYALMALGLTLIFGVTRVLNLAHGHFVAVAGILSYYLFFFGANPFLIILILVLFFFIVGLLFEKILIEPVAKRSHPEIGFILVTLGAAFFIQDVTSFLAGPEDKGIPLIIPSVNIAGIMMSPTHIIGFLTIFGITIILSLFLSKSYTGKSIRAITQNRIAAALIGLNIPRISAITFAIGILFAALGGFFYTLLYSISPGAGIPMALRALCIIVLGGLGSIVGALIGSIILGVSELLVSLYFGPRWSLTVAFLLLIIILIVRPKGLLGRE
jgi:branched-chain amino acid transport system permease protein